MTETLDIVLLQRQEATSIEITVHSFMCCPKCNTIRPWPVCQLRVQSTNHKVTVLPPPPALINSPLVIDQSGVGVLNYVL